jgi:beta-lactamase regulating signal transducer with metallopeptidase domain
MPHPAMNLLLDISRFTAQAFVSGLWQGVVLISAVAIFLRLLFRGSPAARFAIWGVAFALVIAIPLLHLRVQAVQTSHASSAAVHLGAAWGFAIAGVWGVLMMARAAQLLVQAVRLRRIWKRATPVVVESEVLSILQNSRRSAELCTSTDVDSPSVIGFFSPRLLLPEWLLAKLTQSELRQIVLHECQHLNRYDDWMNLLQKVGLVLFPLNPALLWVDRRLGLERELACDAGVVAATAQPFDYAHCLTRLAEHRLRCRRVALALSAWSRQSELARRVHSLLRPVRTMSPLQARVSIALLSLGLAGGAVEMARAPRLVSFTEAVSAPVVEAAAPVIESAAAVRAIPVTYQPATHPTVEQPHATLLKAVLPASPKPRTLRPAKAAVKQPRQAELHAANAVVEPQQPHMVLTTATIQSGNFSFTSVRAVYAMPAGPSPSYAAVPFGDGWLILQL